MKRLLASLEALGSVRFRRYWLGMLCYAGAVRLIMLGQAWLVFQLSRSALDLGLLGAAMAIPAVLITWVGGTLADRIDKRRLLIATSIITTVLLLVQAVLDLTGVVAVWQVIVIAVLLGLVGGLEWPAMQAIVPSLVERRQMMSGIALNAVVWQGTRMVVPALGGMVIALWGTAAVFLLAGAGALSMLLVLTTLDVQARAVTDTRSAGHFVEVAVFIIKERLFAVLIPLAWAAAFFISAFLYLMPVYADLLGVGEAGYGALMSASGVGSVVGTFLVGGFQTARRLGWIMMISLFLAAVCLLGFSLITGFAQALPKPFHLGLVCVSATTMFVSIFMVSAMTVLQLRVPEALRGRVMGIHGIAFNLMPLGALFIGAMASLVGAAGALSVCALIVLGASATVLGSQREVRALDGRARSAS